MITRTQSVRIAVPSEAAVNLLEPESNRDGFVLHNLGGPIYVKLAKYASESNFTYRVPRMGTLEQVGYTGFVSAVAVNAISDVIITELL